MHVGDPIFDSMFDADYSDGRNPSANCRRNCPRRPRPWAIHLQRLTTIDLYRKCGDDFIYVVRGALDWIWYNFISRFSKCPRSAKKQLYIGHWFADSYECTSSRELYIYNLFNYWHRNTNMFTICALSPHCALLLPWGLYHVNLWSIREFVTVLLLCRSKQFRTESHIWIVHS